eukprot:PhM_4_TR109/c0_g1_i1/m.3426
MSDSEEDSSSPFLPRSGSTVVFTPGMGRRVASRDVLASAGSNTNSNNVNGVSGATTQSTSVLVREFGEEDVVDFRDDDEYDGVEGGSLNTPVEAPVNETEIATDSRSTPVVIAPASVDVEKEAALVSGSVASSMVREDSVLMEVVLYLNHVRGSCTLDEMQEALRWERQYEPLWGTIDRFITRHEEHFDYDPMTWTVSIKHHAVGVLKPTDSRRLPASRTTQRKKAPLFRGKVAAICVSNGMDLEHFQKVYRRLDYSSIITNGVLHVTNIKSTFGTFASDSTPRFDLFVFSFGAVVWWGTDTTMFRTVERDFMRGMYTTSRAMKEPYAARLTEKLFPAWGTFEVVNDDSPNLVSSEKFVRNLHQNHYLLQGEGMGYKQTVGYVLAQSAKLDVLENLIDDLVASCAHLPEDMRDRKTTRITAKQTASLQGTLFKYRLMLKSDSELLDEPDLLWDYPWFQVLYESLRDDHSIIPRVEFLDNKLSTVQEVLDVVSCQLSEHHGHRLEWIVIILIATEIVIATIELTIEVLFGAWK